MVTNTNEESGLLPMMSARALRDALGQVLGLNSGHGRLDDGQLNAEKLPQGFH